jgi:hypothetical protein
MTKALVVVLLVVAQILPSCGGGPGGSGDESSGPDVVGWVDEKRTRVWETIPHIIVINQIEYGVPYDFWTSVNVGDLVKYEGGRWSIVRRASR